MFTLPALPYPHSSLEPHISANTLEFHHGKHHAGYVTKLNELLAQHQNLLDSSIENVLQNLNTLVPVELQDAVRKNAAQHYDHSLYWLSMSPQGGGEPVGDLHTAIIKQWGDYTSFMHEFITAGTNQFGSGWVWLSLDVDNNLSIDKTSNEDTPLIHNKTPLLTMDVWEHAYYLDYQNRRVEYSNSFFQIIDWVAANERYTHYITTTVKN